MISEFRKKKLSNDFWFLISDLGKYETKINKNKSFCFSASKISLFTTDPHPLRKENMNRYFSGKWSIFKMWALAHRRYLHLPGNAENVFYVLSVVCWWSGPYPCFPDWQKWCFTRSAFSSLILVFRTRFGAFNMLQILLIAFVEIYICFF
jgi:hypothetical protein